MFILNGCLKACRLPSRLTGLEGLRVFFEKRQRVLIQVSSIFRYPIPAMVGAVFLSASPQQRKRPRSLRVRAGVQNCTQNRHRRDVRAAKRGASHRSETEIAAHSCDRSPLAVGDSKRRNPLPFCSHRGFHRFSQTLPKADGNQQVS
jgi:hypothetical protein